LREVGSKKVYGDLQVQGEPTYPKFIIEILKYGTNSATLILELRSQDFDTIFLMGFWIDLGNDFFSEDYYFLIYWLIHIVARIGGCYRNEYFPIWDHLHIDEGGAMRFGVCI
jgi:hypothetical protein